MPMHTPHSISISAKIRVPEWPFPPTIIGDIILITPLAEFLPDEQAAHLYGA
jgi:hypothetical protein